MHDAQPVIVGVGQLTNHVEDLGEVREPLLLMEDAARRALADVGVAAIASRIDSVRVVNILAATYPDPAGALAARLGLTSGERQYTVVGGNSPQWLVNHAADDLAAGRRRAVLLAGAEAMHALRLAAKARVTIEWSARRAHPATVGDDRFGSHPDEWAHGAQAPSNIYPLFEIALRAHRRLTPTEHRARIAALAASFAAVAAHNPYAWSRHRRTAADLCTVTADNRMIAFPYPKYLNALIGVDQAAAIVMTTAGEAHRLGIPSDRLVYVHGGSEGHDHWFIRDRRDYHSSPGMEAVFSDALEQAAITSDQLGPVDLYSCFPIAVELGARILGFPDDGTRPLTVTGGLPFFGGPGNDYAMHAIATMVERLREKPSTFGFVSALGWYFTKHAAGVYGVAPPSRPWRRDDLERPQRTVDAVPHPIAVERAEGDATVETYTVVHDRDGAPESAIIVARLADGRRVFANAEPDAGLFATLEREEMVGSRGTVGSGADGRNVFRFGGR